jgi:hypothetical protein
MLRSECLNGGGLPWKVNDAVDCGPGPGDRLLGGWCSKDRTAEDWTREEGDRNHY